MAITGKDGKTRNLQRISDSVNSDNAYYTKKNEYGETQADIDNFFNETAKRNPNGLGGKGWVWE